MPVICISNNLHIRFLKIIFSFDWLEWKSNQISMLEYMTVVMSFSEYNNTLDIILQLL